MVIDELIQYLSTESYSPTVRNKVKNSIQKIIKIISKMDEGSYIDLSSIIELFIIDQSEKRCNEAINNYHTNKTKEYANMSDEEKVNELLNNLSSMAEELGFEGMRMGQIDPVTGKVYEYDPDYYNGSINASKHNDDNVSYIERRPLVVHLTDKELRINKPFMTYLKEIYNQTNSGWSNPAMGYDDEDEDELRLTVGTKDDNLILTLTGGVNPYESFTIDELVNDTGVMDSDDFKYLRSKLDKSFNGYYLFKLDDNKQYFIGTKIEMEITM